MIVSFHALSSDGVGFFSYDGGQEAEGWDDDWSPRAQMTDDITSWLAVSLWVVLHGAVFVATLNDDKLHSKHKEWGHMAQEEASRTNWTKLYNSELGERKMGGSEPQVGIGRPRAPRRALSWIGES